MKKSPLWLAVLSALAIQSALTATAVSAAVATPEKTTSIVTRDLLAQSDLVFSGKVVSVEYKDSVDGLPHTFVTYSVDQVISGRPDGSQVTLRFLGGRQQKGEVVRYLEVSETPQFQVGDTDVLFASKNNSSICPLAKCTSGRFRNLDGVLASDDGRAIIEKTDSSYAISNTVITKEAADNGEVGHGANALASVAREPVSPVVPASAIKAEQFIADLREQAREVASARADTPVFVSASIRDEFKSAAMTPEAAPADAAPNLLRRITTPTDFDRWEEDAVRKNNGNPVL
ncbi:hypothetical protein [Cellvibrio mixtus]|uniref:hypothetical protein n=1 Tax=Cellvibrio mixtus TaxID=39650 RepID=UPI000587B334|nr:hypothetical protein [Cellvibrio mixtus]